MIPDLGDQSRARAPGAAQHEFLRMMRRRTGALRWRWSGRAPKQGPGSAPRQTARAVRRGASRARLKLICRSPYETQATTGREPGWRSSGALVKDGARVEGEHENRPRSERGTSPRERSHRPQGASGSADISTPRPIFPRVTTDDGRSPGSRVAVFLPPSRDAKSQWVIWQRTRRLQLRGQPRHWRRKSPHRIPY